MRAEEVIPAELPDGRTSIIRPTRNALSYVRSLRVIDRPAESWFVSTARKYLVAPNRDDAIPGPELTQRFVGLLKALFESHKRCRRFADFFGLDIAEALTPRHWEIINTIGLAPDEVAIVKGRKLTDDEIERFFGETAIAKAHPDDPVSNATLLGRTNQSTLPRNKVFRGAWRIKKGSVVVDMPLARDIKMKRIRNERNARLQSSDGPSLVAQERGSPVDRQRWVAYRNALRDLPQTINLEWIATPEELESFEPAWPEEPTDG